MKQKQLELSLGIVKMKYTKLVALNIDYDTDGEKLDLPEKMVFYVHSDLVDDIIDESSEITDMITDETGFLVFGYDLEVEEEDIDHDDCGDVVSEYTFHNS